jgi:hypothetical protein
MSKVLLAVAVLYCSSAYAATNTKPVGTATVRGNVRIDGSEVQSNATLFDGSVVETAEASTTLEMNGQSVVMMTPDTRSVVHDDYVRLDQGKIDLRPACGFVVEAGQLRITPNSPTSHAVIYISNSSVSVMAMDGEFLILNKEGRLVSKVHDRSSQSFSTGEVHPLTPAIYVGSLSDLDTHPVLTLLGPENKIEYELHGRKASKIEGRLALVSGTIDPKLSSFFTEEVIATKGETAVCTQKGPFPYMLVGFAAAAAAGGGAAIVITNNPNPPASR